MATARVSNVVPKVTLKECDMEGSGAKINCSIEDSQPDAKTRRAELPLLIGSGPTQKVTLGWLHKKCIGQMNFVGCPLTNLCGKELAHDLYIQETQKDLTQVENIEAWMSKVIKKRSLNKKRDCRCDLTVEFVESGDLAESAQDDEGLAPTIPLNKYPRQARNPEQIYERALILEAIVLQLNDEERELFELVHLERRLGKEVAAVLGLSHDVVRKRVSRLKTKLRDIIASLSLETLII